MGEVRLISSITLSRLLLQITPEKRCFLIRSDLNIIWTLYILLSSTAISSSVSPLKTRSLFRHIFAYDELSSLCIISLPELRSNVAFSSGERITLSLSEETRTEPEKKCCDDLRVFPVGFYIKSSS